MSLPLLGQLQLSECNDCSSVEDDADTQSTIFHIFRVAGVSKEDSPVVSAVEVDGDDPDDSHGRQEVGDGHEGGAGLDQPRHP